MPPSRRTLDFDVAVVGYGPTGQASASLLAALGHRVVVYERWPALYGLPRLIGFDAESVRMMQQAGDVRTALRESFPFRASITVNRDYQRLTALDFPEEHPCGYPVKTATYQPYIEDAMDEAARERGVRVNTGWRVTGLEQDDEGVTVHAAPWSKEEVGENLRPATTRAVRVRYVVGADGANSVVRRELGIERDDLDYRDAWLSVDVERRDPLPPLFMYGTAHMVADPGNVVVIVPAGTKRLRFEFQVDHEEDNSHLLTEEVGYRLLRDQFGLTREQVEIVRLTIYPFSGQMCPRWRDRRVFLAGDAAHLMPPFLGEGAASGMRDATNLAWKLDHVLRGVADPALLDTYEEERYPHALANVVDSIALGRIVTERDPVKAAETSALLLSDEAPEPPPDPILTTGILLRDAEGSPVPLAGELAPQGYVHRDGVTAMFDDVVGWGFHVVARDADPLELLDEEQRAFLETIRGHAVGVSREERPGLAVDVHWTYDRYFDEHGIAAFIMRPDFYVFGTVTSLDDLPAAVDDLRRQLAVTG